MTDSIYTDDIQHEFIGLWFEGLDNKKQSDIKYSYIEMLIDQGYRKTDAENTDDGRDEYLLDVYNNL